MDRLPRTVQQYVSLASSNEDVTTCMLLDCRDHKYVEMALLELPDVFVARWLVHNPEACAELWSVNYSSLKFGLVVNFATQF